MRLKRNESNAVGNDKIAFELVEAYGDFELGKVTENYNNHVNDSNIVPEEMWESIFYF